MCNSKVIIDWDLLKQLKKKSTKEDLGSLLSDFEFSNAIKKLTIHKVTGLNDISPNVVKALNERNRRILFDICVKYFDGDVNIEE